MQDNNFLLHSSIISLSCISVGSLLYYNIQKKNKIKYFLLQGKKYKSFGDFDKSIEFYNKAKLLHSIDAYYYLGKYLYNGISVDKNISLACKYFKYAAKRNHIKSMFKLYTLYRQLHDHFECDIKLSNYWFKKSLHMDYHKALVQQAKIILRDPNFDDKESIVYLEKAYNMNNYEAAVLLGYLHITGRGFNHINIKKGREYYEIAANNENPIAIYRIGIALQNGLWGYSKNILQGKEYCLYALYLDNTIKDHPNKQIN